MKTLAPPKELPILMSAPMVRALLDGTKLETRRTRGLKDVNAFLRKHKVTELVQDHLNFVENYAEFTGFTDGRGYTSFKKVKFPYGGRGTRLWVRETWAVEPRYNHLPPSEIPRSSKLYYNTAHVLGGTIVKDHHKSRPSIHMPRWASRIMLEVTDWDCQRLHQIDEDGALAEGCKPDEGRLIKSGPGIDVYESKTPRGVYADLWNKINGPKTWDLNPFVWVIKFKRIE